MQKNRKSVKRLKSKQQEILNEQNQEQRLRILKHDKFIEKVMKHMPTLEDSEKLYRMRKYTQMEIQMRYKNSKENHTYVFQCCHEDLEDDDLSGEMKILAKALYYDLHKQNRLNIKQKIELEQKESRRVKSLDQAMMGVQSQKSIKKLRKIQKLSTELKQMEIEEVNKLKRSKTKSNSLKKIIFPALGRKIENFKTEVESNQDQHIGKLLSKKLFTQSSSQSPVKITKRKNLDYNFIVN